MTLAFVEGQSGSAPCYVPIKNEFARCACRISPPAGARSLYSPFPLGIVPVGGNKTFFAVFKISA